MARQRRIRSLSLSHKRFPFGLTGHGGETFPVFLPIEIIHCIADHEYVGAAAEDLHVEDPDLFLAFHDFGPDVLVNIAEEPNNIQFVQQFSGLADDYNGISHMGRTISFLKLRIYVLIH